MTKEEVKIIFMGTPRFAAVILEKLIAADYHVMSVFSQPDKKTGRKRELRFSPVKVLAKKNEIEVFQPENFKEKDIIEKISRQKPDLVIVAAYGKILPKSILEIPKYGAINVHASLLPKFRGASPIQEAILSGEKKTGVTIMLMSGKMDAGEIINQQEIRIKKSDTVLTLSEKLARLGGEVLADTLPLWIQGTFRATAQNEKEATYCRIIKKDNGKIDWNEPAEKIERMFRAYQPWPGIFTNFSSKGKEKRFQITGLGGALSAESRENAGKVIKYKKDIAVQTGKGILAVKKIKPEGKKEMRVDDFSRGSADFVGSVLE